MPEPDETPPPVRQRNTTGYAYNVAETEDHPAYAVQPGETAVFPELLDGWTAVDDEPDPAPADDETRAKTSGGKRTVGADTETKDGGESR